jgi:hypothetical protein
MVCIKDLLVCLYQETVKKREKKVEIIKLGEKKECLLHYESSFWL